MNRLHLLIPIIFYKQLRHSILQETLDGYRFREDDRILTKSISKEYQAFGIPMWNSAHELYTSRHE